jgi:hypothetical protein
MREFISLMREINSLIATKFQHSLEPFRYMPPGEKFFCRRTFSSTPFFQFLLDPLAASILAFFDDISCLCRETAHRMEKKDEEGER